MKNFVSLVVVSSLISTNALAVCEGERSEYADWNAKCETLSATSQVTGAAGGIFAIVTFGASMIPCAAAIAAANNACRIKREKQKNLAKCERYQATLATDATLQAQQALAAEQARQERISSINANFSTRRAEINQRYEQMIQSFVNNFVAEGWNIEDVESQELIQTTRAAMEHERDQLLDALEVERRASLANA